MKYLVELADRAVRDLELLYVEKHVAHSQAAALWYNGLERTVARLESYPLRCPVASESRTMKRKLRHLLYGRESHVYRVIYEVDEVRQVVRVLTIRHGARQIIELLDLP